MLRDRVTPLNDRAERDGRCIVYWMQSSLRTSDNPALELAAREANTHRLPLLVLFTVDPSIPMASERSFTFMLESLADVARNVEGTGASMCVRLGSAVEHAIGVCREADASFLITDESHLNEGARRRQEVARSVKVPMLQVDANVVVPVRQIPGEQYAAYTIRPRLQRLLDRYLQLAPAPEVRDHRAVGVQGDVDVIDVKRVLKGLKLRKVVPSPLYSGGERNAGLALQGFVDRKLDGYADNRNHPELDATSNLSPYLRFGCISPVSALKTVMDSNGQEADIKAFTNEALVWRELAENFTFYNRSYRSLEGLPEWASRTLDDHRGDTREHLFSLGELEAGATGDDLWDASQHELLRTGKMSGYMRMYWGKRVIEWTPDPEEALRVLLYLNDKYEIDGRSPNGYAGVLWCFGKHDRAFGERRVFGKVRYMSPAAVRQKVDLGGYRRKIGYEEKRATYA
jgi:deoxyribodipyrimidine photo-lyase